MENESLRSIMEEILKRMPRHNINFLRHFVAIILELEEEGSDLLDGFGNLLDDEAIIKIMDETV